MAGVEINPLALHKDLVTFPVPRGTTMISPLIKWDHTISWNVPKHHNMVAGDLNTKSSAVFEIDISSESEDHYLIDHKIDERILVPAAGYLVWVWKTFAKLHGQVYEHMMVVFKDVHIHMATVLSTTGTAAENFVPTQKFYKVT